MVELARLESAGAITNIVTTSNTYNDLPHDPLHSHTTDTTGFYAQSTHLSTHPAARAGELSGAHQYAIGILKW